MNLRAVALVSLLLVLAGCGPVPAHQRGAHAHRCMKWSPQESAGALREHVLDVREGKPGSAGSAGSGCGCG